jgi:hypothetical protein
MRAAKLYVMVAAWLGAANPARNAVTKKSFRTSMISERGARGIPTIAKAGVTYILPSPNRAQHKLPDKQAFDRQKKFTPDGSFHQNGAQIAPPSGRRSGTPSNLNNTSAHAGEQQ